MSSHMGLAHENSREKRTPPEFHVKLSENSSDKMAR